MLSRVMFRYKMTARNCLCPLCQSSMPSAHAVCILSLTRQQVDKIFLPEIFIHFPPRRYDSSSYRPMSETFRLGFHERS